MDAILSVEDGAEVKAGERYWVSIKGGDFKAAYLVEFGLPYYAAFHNMATSGYAIRPSRSADAAASSSR